jgi:hypothetical protein
MIRETLGVDVGGVLIDRIADNTDTSFFSTRFLETPAVIDAFGTIARLGRERFGDAVHLVSKCGPTTEEKTKLWLAHHRFAEITGVPLERVHFCRTREEKGPICAELGVTHFVDDRYDVLSYVTTVSRRYLFRPRDNDLERSRREALPDLSVVHSWTEIAADLLP